MSLSLLLLHILHRRHPDANKQLPCVAAAAICCCGCHCGGQALDIVVFLLCVGLPVPQKAKRFYEQILCLSRVFIVALVLIIAYSARPRPSTQSFVVWCCLCNCAVLAAIVLSKRWIRAMNSSIRPLQACFGLIDGRFHHHRNISSNRRPAGGCRMGLGWAGSAAEGVRTWWRGCGWSVERESRGEWR